MTPQMKQETKGLDLEAIRARYGVAAPEGIVDQMPASVANRFVIAAVIECDVPLLIAEVERQAAEIERYRLLQRAVCEADDSCVEGCDSYGHAEGCRVVATSRWLEDQQAEIERLRAAAHDWLQRDKPTGQEGKTAGAFGLLVAIEALWIGQCGERPEGVSHMIWKEITRCLPTARAEILAAPTPSNRGSEDA